MKKKEKPKVRSSSGNVFADLNIPNPEAALAKAEVASQIHIIVKRRKLTQAKVAKLLNITQSKVSLLLRGYLANFSLERLFRFLNDLGQDVYINIVPSAHRGQGFTRIGVAMPSKSRMVALSK